MKPTHQPPGCKPCPWCCQTDRLVIEDMIDLADRNRRAVFCSRCGVSGPGGEWHQDLSAIAAWNKRALPDARPSHIPGGIPGMSND